MLAQTSMHVRISLLWPLLLRTDSHGHRLSGFRKTRLVCGVVTHLGRRVRCVLLTIVVWLNMQR